MSIAVSMRLAGVAAAMALILIQGGQKVAAVSHDAVDADDKRFSGPNCAANAFNAYQASLLAILHNNAALPPGHSQIEFILSRRRIQELYCLRFAQCSVPQPTKPEDNPKVAKAFDTCLRDVDVEQYRELMIWGDSVLPAEVELWGKFHPLPR